jgi:hypothetical protein
MAKRVVAEPVNFNPGTATITIPNRIINREQLLLVVNTVTNTVLYNFSDPDLSLISYTKPYEVTGTQFVVNYDTSTMSSSDAIMVMEDIPAERIDFSETVQDPTNKLRVAQPQSLIDTDFEYGLQPIKWESLTLIQNIPAFFYRGGGNSVSVGAIVGGNQSPRSTIAVATTVPHGLEVSDFVNVVNTVGINSSRAEGSFQVLTATSTGFTYLAKGQVNGSILSPYTSIQGGGRFDSNNVSSNIVLFPVIGNLVSTNAATSMITVFTNGPHGLLRGTPIMVMSSTTVNINGNWSVFDVPTASSFRFETPNIATGTTVPNSSTVAIYVNPEANFIHRSSDGGVLINTTTVQEGIQAIRQTRRYFRYQSGKGVQMSTGTKFTPTLDINDMSSVGTSVTCSVQQPLTFSTGISIVMEGVEVNQGTPNFYNGVFTVSAVNLLTRTFTYNTTTSNTDTIPGGKPQVTIKNWRGANVKAGLFDNQNGFFFEYDGQDMYAVQRQSIKEGMGTVQVTQGSVFVTGTSTRFSKQLNAGDNIVIRGQTYQVTQVNSDISISVSPKYSAPNATGLRFNITVDIRFPQNQWNIDRCDGNGISGYNLNLAKMQMCYIDYTWYGAGAVRYGFRGPNGDIIFVHKTPNNNRNNQAYMRSGNLPGRYEVTNTGPYSRLISGNINTIGQNLASGDTTMVVRDAERWPNDGAIMVQQGQNVEYMFYGAKEYNATLNGWNLIGLDRRAIGGTTSAVTFIPAAFDGGTVGASSVCSVTYVTCDCAPVINHWGTSVIMDGRFDEDRSIVFSYGKRRETIVNANSSIAILSIRLAPSVDNSITGGFGVRDIVNRMQLKLLSIGTNSTGPLLLTGVLNPTRYTGAAAGLPNLPTTWGVTSVVSVIGSASLAQVIDHTSNNTTIQGGEQIFSFFADSGTNTYDLKEVRDLGNSLLGGEGSNRSPGYPNGPDILVIMANSVTSTTTNLRGLRISWTEAQA